MKKLLIIGGNGHGSVISSCVKDNQRHNPNYDIEIAGYVNDYEKEIDGYSVLGTLKDIPMLISKGYYFIWAIHLIGRNVKTKQVFDTINIPNDYLLSVIHHSAFISENVELGTGCLVAPHAFIGARTKIGECSMIKANACIGHDVVCGSLCHFALNSTTGALSQLGTCSDVAMGAVVNANIKIGDYAMLGSNSLAMHDISNKEIHVGTPAKFLKMMREN